MKLANNLLQQAKYLWYFVALFCIIEIANLLTGRALNQFGIIPRELSSLGYIFTAPFLHANLQHFLSNIVTITVFALVTLQFGNQRFVLATLLIIVFTGLLVWIFGRYAYHIGASGLLYGYFGFLLVAGWLQQRLTLLLISIMTALFYGGIIWGVLPTQAYVSWESHLAGFVSGLAVAWLSRANKK